MGSSSQGSERSRLDAGPAGVRDRLGDLFARAANRASEGAERLREAAGAGLRPSILQHAHAARERGNREAAFWLLDEAFRAAPEDREVQLAFWDAAVALDRGGAAAAAGVALVEGSAAAGDPDGAARHFATLTEQVPEARISPAAVARMLPPLSARMAVSAEADARSARELARRALSHALRRTAEDEPALTPGLAFHLFREARQIDSEAARRIAEIALASSDLHEVKRRELERFLADELRPTGAPELELDPDEVSHPELEVDADEFSDPELKGEDDAEPVIPLPAAEAEPVIPLPAAEAEPVIPPLSPEEVVDAARRLVDRHGPLATEAPPRPHPGHLEILRAVPADLDEQALVLRLPGGRASRVGWKEIQALSVARLGPDPSEPPEIVIDLILNWRRRRREPLRVVRFYAADFVPEELLDGSDPDLSAFLSDLFERCQAAPLPDPESALGVRIAVFPDLESYQREVLGH